MDGQVVAAPASSRWNISVFTSHLSIYMQVHIQSTHPVSKVGLPSVSLTPPFRQQSSVVPKVRLLVLIIPLIVFFNVLNYPTDAIVPGAQYVTILRSPMSHFRSAWRYWQIGQSIASRSGFKGSGSGGLITPEDFFQDEATQIKFVPFNLACGLCPPKGPHSG